MKAESEARIKSEKELEKQLAVTNQEARAARKLRSELDQMRLERDAERERFRVQYSGDDLYVCPECRRKQFFFDGCSEAVSTKTVWMWY